MGLSITILGCDGSYAAAGGACSGYLVSTDTTRVWLDCGPGTAGELQRHVSLADLDAIVLSHEHPDHWLELPTVYNAIRYYETRPRLPVYGTAGTLQLFQAFAPTFDDSVAWTTIDKSSEFSVGDLDWCFSRTDHPVETLASRVSNGDKSIVYTSDTGPGWSAVSLGDAPDVLVSEATILADQEDAQIPHLSARQAGLAAAEAGAKRLVITHLAPGSESGPFLREASEAFGGPVELARIGQRFDA